MSKRQRSTSSGQKSNKRPKTIVAFRKKTVSVEPEVKFIDIAAAAQANGTVYFKSSIAAGTGEQQRVGNKVTIVKINARCLMSSVAPAAAPYLAVTYRWLIFVDKSPNGVAPLVTDLLETNTFESYLNMENMERFQILHDRFYDMNANDAATPSGETQQMATFNKKVNILCHFSGTAGNIASARTGQIFSLMMNSNAPAAGSKFESNFRIKYTDV